MLCLGPACQLHRRQGPDLHATDNLSERERIGVIAGHRATYQCHPHGYTLCIYDSVELDVARASDNEYWTHL